MRKFLAVMAVSAALAGCQSNNPNDRVLAGGLIGAGTGAIIGGVATGRAGGAVAGALIGGAGGAILGGATTPNRGYRYRDCTGYDEYGEPVRVRC